MATLFNNTEITNAFFNGTELDKIYFNGVLVFEKGGKYLRRIMVGDNLKGKTLYFDGLTKEEMTSASSAIRAENTSFIIETLPDIGISALKGDDLPSIGVYPYFKIQSIGPTVYLYDIYNDELETYLSESTIKNDKDYIVTDIAWKYASFAGGEYIDNDGFLYRKFYIEDENIRPLKVGDYVLDNTIFYFTFPDDIYLKEDDLAFREYLIEIEQDPIIDNEGKNWILTLSWEDWNEAKRVLYGHGKSGSASYHDNYAIYKYSTKEQELKKNLSKVIAEDMENLNGNIHYYCRGKVIKISKSQNFASHILVDTRTLGTSGYKRRIMVGDNLRGKIIYQDFPQNYNENEKFIGVTEYTSNRIVIIDDSTHITEAYYGSDEAVYVQTSNSMVDGGAYANAFYYFDVVGTDPAYISNVTCKNDTDFIVTSIIDDNSSYKHLYIEDHKIRPLQVGDRITENTVFYFTFPDNLRDELLSLEGSHFGTICKLNTNEFDGEWRIDLRYSSNSNICKVSYLIATKQAQYSNTYANFFSLEHQQNFSTISPKNMLRINGNIFSGVVSEIDSSSPIYSMILVDITTLG